MTLDGKVATAHRRLEVDLLASRRASAAHHWRASVDAVVVGIGTALADDPQLTARIEGVDMRQPRRVVFDSTARLPLDSQLVAQADEIPLTRRRLARRAARRRPTRWRSPAPTSSSPPASTSPRACAPRSTSSATRGDHAMLLEGGPHLAGAFLDAGEIDELRLFIAPLLLGGRAARDPLEGEGVERIAEARARADARAASASARTSCITARLREW